jgi:hypothetical protein
MPGTMNRASVSSAELSDMIMYQMRPSGVSRPMQSVSAPPTESSMFHQDYGFNQQMLDSSSLNYSTRPSLKVVIPHHRGAMAQMVWL